MENMQNLDKQELSPGTADVAIDGRVYSLAGGDADYLKRVGAYVDEKIAELKKSGAYSSQTTEYRNVLVYLNLADDYMREHEEAGKLKKEAEAHDAEVYSLKRELVEKRVEAEKLRAECVSLKKEQETSAEKVRTLSEKDAEIARQSGKLSEASGRIHALEQQLKAQTEKAAAFQKRAEELENRVKEETARAEKLQADIDELLSK